MSKSLKTNICGFAAIALMIAAGLVVFAQTTDTTPVATLDATNNAQTIRSQTVPPAATGTSATSSPATMSTQGFTPTPVAPAPVAPGMPMLDPELRDMLMRRLQQLKSFEMQLNDDLAVTGRGTPAAERLTQQWNANRAEIQRIEQQLGTRQPGMPGNSMPGISPMQGRGMMPNEMPGMTGGMGMMEKPGMGTGMMGGGMSPEMLDLMREREMAAKNGMGMSDMPGMGFPTGTTPAMPGGMGGGMGMPRGMTGGNNAPMFESIKNELLFDLRNVQRTLTFVPPQDPLRATLETRQADLLSQLEAINKQTGESGVNNPAGMGIAAGLPPGSATSGSTMPSSVIGTPAGIPTAGSISPIGIVSSTEVTSSAAGLKPGDTKQAASTQATNPPQDPMMSAFARQQQEMMQPGGFPASLLPPTQTTSVQTTPSTALPTAKLPDPNDDKIAKLQAAANQLRAAGQIALADQVLQQAEQWKFMKLPEPKLPDFVPYNPENANMAAPWLTQPSKELVELKGTIESLRNEINGLRSEVKSLETQLQLLNRNSMHEAGRLDQVINKSETPSQPSVPEANKESNP
ncbi:MAG: hypothetical protein FWC50_12030 [Planctomycetaceae bacterium]|nr:hypothetical protein [Planctomycetaceae bacterium]